MKLIKVSFNNVGNLVHVRNELRPWVQKKKNREKVLSHNEMINPSDKLDLMDMIKDLREDDVPYHVRVCIDNEIRCGMWYKVRHDDEFGCKVTPIHDKFTIPDLRILAFDIETTKAPLKFPDPTIDSIMLISYMIDGHGFLISNRSIMSEDINNFDYSPKPEFESQWRVFNEPDEKSLLIKFATHCKEIRPTVIVTFNGDFFDIPFIAERLKVYGMSLDNDFGIEYGGVSKMGDSAFMGRFTLHMDCLHWVKRDAFLPQGSQGLKSVTKAKLNYDPIEVDPEKMVKFAREQPQQLANYSVSDALATYYLYKLMIHDFIYALSTIIPTYPDEILRKGSGTLCEELLMAQAFRCEILFPNKQVDEFEKFYSGHLIDSETYIGGHVECLNVGVYRNDIPVKFRLDETAYHKLIANTEKYLEFCITIENGKKVDECENIQEIKNQTNLCLQSIIDSMNSQGMLEVTPLIYHLDVGAMYPNIILTNRLQPVSIVNEQICAGCVYNRDENNCKRPLNWKWKGELFPLNRSEYENLKHQYEYELLNISDVKEIEELSVQDHKNKFVKRIKNYCSKVYKQAHLSKIEEKEDVVCMRENSFYVDTVRDFRDRRYEFKAKVKFFKGKLDEARKLKDFEKIEESKNLMGLYESLQLAYKIILNSFYGYVMRKGARWFSMEMAAMVTHIGSQIIMDTRVLVDQIGKPLELDTDGIWGLLPLGFPENFDLKFKDGKKIKFSYPCSMLNSLVYDKFSNKQYQALDLNTKKYVNREEMSIFFEVDGPYKCMFIPAAKEEGKMLKKRYAVYSLNGKLHELKGFELKRRGELKLIKIFQGEVFDHFLKGKNLLECYDSCAKVADRWYSILENKGYGITDEELMDYIEECKTMSKPLSEYGAQKSTSITTAKRIAEILGSEIIKGKGLNVKYIIAKKPIGAPVAERAVPTIIFYSDSLIKKKFLKKWLKDSSEEMDMREIIDWDYYKERLGSTIMKIILIPAAIQKLENPLPKIQYPDWVTRMMKEKNEDQKNLNHFFKNITHQERLLQIENMTKSLQLSGKKSNPDNKVNNRNDDSKEIVEVTKKLNNNSIEGFVKKGKGKGIIEYESNQANTSVVNQEVPQVTVNMLDDFENWLKQSKARWKQQIVNKTKNVNMNKINPTSPVKNIASALFQTNSQNIKSKEELFRKSTLKILQIIENNSGKLKLWVSYANYTEVVYINVRRNIYINSHKTNVPDIFKPVKLTLPRSKPTFNLYEFESEEKDFREKFNNFNDYLVDPMVEGVYESKIPLLFK